MSKPTITSLSSSFKVRGSNEFVLSIVGTEFIAASEVFLDGVALTTTYIDSTHLSAVVPASKLLSVHTYDLTISGYGAGASEAQYLTFVSGNPNSYSNGTHARASITGTSGNPHNQYAIFSLPGVALSGGTTLNFHPYGGSLLFVSCRLLYLGSLAVQICNGGTCVGFSGTVNYQYDQVEVYGNGWSAGAACELDVAGIVQRTLYSDPSAFNVMEPGKIFTLGVKYL